MSDADKAGRRYAVESKHRYRVGASNPAKSWFDDKGMKDVSNFLNAGYTVTDIVERIGSDWVLPPRITSHRGMEPVREPAEA